ncbi:ubiquitin-conjugating enzyme E2 S isoform X1 [Centruroides vittatus]|uniref:ubiquitin-conjugating enzyme E2 S-like isoform X1 n=1 Tax=Centruroides sculpturatus TaxID=218467 RepID=UPI000C6EFEB3|nr:ubiquitin-conjugating enzyme E2 S-like isoform X1 [Centruroides sculpturatus]
MSSNSNVENLSPQVIRQVSKELTELASNPPEGIKILLNEDDITDIQALLEGPAGTPYAGGMFRVKLVLGKDFPSGPPKGYFVTKIFHPNVARNGEICVNTLKKDWKPDLGLKHILLTIKCLLIVPNPESALNEEAGKLLLDHYDDYCKRAKMMTEIHAQPPKFHKEGLEMDPSSSNAGNYPLKVGDGPMAKKHAGDKNKSSIDKKNLKIMKDKRRTLKRL